MGSNLLSRFLVGLFLISLFSCISVSDKVEYDPHITIEVSVTQRFPSALKVAWPMYKEPGFYQYRLYVDTSAVLADSVEPHYITSLVSDTSLLVSGLIPETAYYIYLEVTTAGGTTRSERFSFETSSVAISTFDGTKEGSMVRIPSGSFWFFRLEDGLDTIKVETDSVTKDSIIAYSYKDSTVATISRDFMMDTVEVTRELWGSIMQDSAISGTKPMNNISWYEVVLFCNERSKTSGYDTAYVYDSIVRSTFDDRVVNMINLQCNFYNGGYRLPTEDEWILAYRGGADVGYYWGTIFGPADSLIYPNTVEDSLEFGQYLWWFHNLGDEPPFAVAKKLPNEYGLYDMAGNVQEHLWNAYEVTEVYKNRVDYTGLAPDNNYNSRRKYKGGDYTNSYPDAFTDWAHARWFSASRVKKDILGFRNVRTPKEFIQ